MPKTLTRRLTLSRSCLTVAALILPLALALASCGPEPPPSPTAPQPVENAQLGLQLTDVPEGFVLGANEGEEIVLERRAGLTPGTMVVTARPELERGGVNLVAALNERADEVAETGGILRQVELGSHLGPAYLARSRWPGEGGDDGGGDNGGEREQMQIFALHPTANRMLVITYDYPLTGDTQDRREHMMDALSLVAALEEGSTGEAGADAAEGDTESEEQSGEEAP